MDFLDLFPRVMIILTFNRTEFATVKEVEKMREEFAEKLKKEQHAREEADFIIARHVADISK